MCSVVREQSVPWRMWFMLLYVPPKQSRIQIISAYEPSVWLSSAINHSVQALITYSVAQASHVVTLICIAMLRRRLILCSALAMVTRQELTENNIKCTKHIWARKDSSKRLLNDMCEISAVINLANVAMKKLLLDLQCLQRNHPSAVLLQTQLCSRGRTCLSAGTCLVSLASL